MRVTALIVAFALGLVISGGRAEAEKVKTNQSTKLFSRPGEQSKVLLTVKSGQNMTLLGEDGRWLKVRVKGRTGYVPRSKVDMADDGEIARNTRRRPFVDGRSKRRGFGGDGAPDDRVGADALREGQEEDEEEEAPRPKKASKPPKGEDEEEDEEEEAPKPKAKKPPGKAVDEEEEEEEAPKKRAAAEDDEEARPVPRDDEEDEEEDDPIDVKDEAEEARAIARVGKQVSVYEEPDADSDEQFVVRPSDILYPMDQKGKWTFVENAEGDGGWVETEFLEMGSEGGGGGPRRRSIELRARGGLTFIQQGMRTQGSTNTSVPDNYNIGTSSVTMSIGGGVLMPFGKKTVLGAEATYDFAKTLFGGVFYDPDKDAGPMPGVNIGVTLHNINVRGVAGIDLKKKSGMMVTGRLGYRYQSFLVANYADVAKNPAKLPQEVVKAPTLGAALSIPKLTGKIGLRFSLDAILFGSSIKQTEGLEDGLNASAKAVVVGTAFTYRWKPALDLQATYDLNYMGVDFGAPPASSTRGHMGTSVSRTDFMHMVTFGVAKPF